MNLKILFLIFLFSMFAVFPENWESKLRDRIQKNNFPLWMEKQIEADLEIFQKGGIKSSSLDEIIAEGDKLGNNPCLFARYKIKNGEFSVAYSKRLEISPKERYESVTNALMKLSECVFLPDVDIIVCLHDKLISTGALEGPILVFAKNPGTDSRRILIPDSEALGGYADLLQEVDRARIAFPWRRKIRRAIWRGQTAGQINGDAMTTHNYSIFPRGQLINISLQFPKYLDAKFTQLWPDDNLRELFLQKRCLANHMSVFNQIRYKYQILVDGNTCAYSRAYWQLHSNCVILKQNSPDIQWYYGIFKPFIHYIPVNSDSSDLPEKVQWAINHEYEVQQIIKRANNLANENLKYEDIMLYFYLVIKKYSELMIN